MNSNIVTFIGLFVSSAASAALAASPAPTPSPTASYAPSTAMTADGAYTRDLPPSATNGAVYLVLKNSSVRPAELVHAESPLAEVVEIHQHQHIGHQMKMERVLKVTVPGSGSLEFKPMGLHLMLIGLKPQYHAAKLIPITLRFADQTSLRIEAVIRKSQD